jgi:radical SAM-linked protein
VKGKGVTVLNSIRIRFIRGDEVKFISHLDLMKSFERTLRRSGIPVAYSQGFNPRPQMVFGLPLSVGVSSEAEYADFEMAEYIAPSEFMNRMNNELPKGIRITDARVKSLKGNIMASVAGAVYNISVFLKEGIDIEEIREKISCFTDKSKIIVRKEGKGGVRDMDIKPMIQKLDLNPIGQIPPGYEDFKTAFLLTAALKAGSVSNLKPELLIIALAEDTSLSIGAFRIHRKELFIEKEGRMVDPMEGLEVIGIG